MLESISKTTITVTTVTHTQYIQQFDCDRKEGKYCNISFFLLFSTAALHLKYVMVK